MASVAEAKQERWPGFLLELDTSWPTLWLICALFFIVKPIYVKYIYINDYEEQDLRTRLLCCGNHVGTAGPQFHTIDTQFSLSSRGGTAAAAADERHSHLATTTATD